MEEKMSYQQFKINKNLDNEFHFQIKQNGSTLAMQITNTDTFVCYLINKETDAIVCTIDSSNSVNGSLTVSNAANGRLKLIFKSALTSTLLKEVGPKEERYYIKPLYRLLINCNTLNNGIMNIQVDNVYVE